MHAERLSFFKAVLFISDFIIIIKIAVKQVSGYGSRCMNNGIKVLKVTVFCVGCELQFFSEICWAMAFCYEVAYLLVLPLPPTVTNRRRSRFRIDTEVRCVGAHPPFGPLSRRGLNPVKPVYDPDQPDGQLNLTASAFNQLGSPGRRGYCYAELAVFFPNGGRNHRQYSLRLPTEGWPG